jgi:hypothetical protein
LILYFLIVAGLFWAPPQPGETIFDRFGYFALLPPLFIVNCLIYGVIVALLAAPALALALIGLQVLRCRQMWTFVLAGLGAGVVSSAAWAHAGPWALHFACAGGGALGGYVYWRLAQPKL